MKLCNQEIRKLGKLGNWDTIGSYEARKLGNWETRNLGNQDTIGSQEARKLGKTGNQEIGKLVNQETRKQETMKL